MLNSRLSRIPLDMGRQFLMNLNHLLRVYLHKDLKEYNWNYCSQNNAHHWQGAPLRQIWVSLRFFLQLSCFDFFNILRSFLLLLYFLGCFLNSCRGYISHFNNWIRLPKASWLTKCSWRIFNVWGWQVHRISSGKLLHLNLNRYNLSKNGKSFIVRLHANCEQSFGFQTTQHCDPAAAWQIQTKVNVVVAIQDRHWRQIRSNHRGIDDVRWRQLERFSRRFDAGFA